MQTVNGHTTKQQKERSLNSSPNHRPSLLYYVNFSKPLTIADAAEMVLFHGEIQVSSWFQFLKPFADTAKPRMTRETFNQSSVPGEGRSGTGS